ncbi:bifunctional histidinol-phosphatase/imidazoleglycerol-phosphate dehydratase HisB [Buchnera aphidicola]|uniref:bifunctional histidinol-phosphatase/imidazoleglycerol-phosphate dehydratase HisB n=1 Tax=Buchnera aphidicola TaxID=9 RepID=UPI0031B874DE
MLNKYLFIDRDGTLINEPLNNFQVDSIDKLYFEFDVIRSLFNLINYGYKLVIITNQDGLGTKNFSKNNFNIPNNFMLKVFSSQGVFFEKVLICPHYSYENCVCRKPKIFLLKSILSSNLIDLENSYVIGDRETDMELAKNAGVKGILYNKNNYNWSKITFKLTKINRCIKVVRNTLETNIFIEIFLDKKLKNNINTGINFFDHMLEQIAIHAGFFMNVIVIGNLKIDDHHIIEDVAILLGKALLKTLGNKIGIKRFSFVVSMDESFSKCIIDISGRSYLIFKVDFKFQYIGDLSSEMIKHFFISLSNSMKINIHLSAKGKNDHHIFESLFKVFGKALGKAMKIKGLYLPTSKGVL